MVEHIFIVFQLMVANKNWHIEIIAKLSQYKTGFEFFEWNIEWKTTEETLLN